MKSYSVLSTLLFVCMLALSLVWAAPVESEAVESEAAKPSEVSVANSNEQACNDWFNAAYSQSARPLAARDRYSDPFPPYPPPPSYPPYPPPPTYPPYPPKW